MKNIIFDKDNRGNRKILGSGGFGIVYLGTLGTIKVAIKELELNKFGGGKDGILEELNFIVQVKHPNICNIIGISEDDNEYISLVTKYYECGDLSAILLNKNIKISERLKKKLLLDVAEGMAFLHSKGIIYRNLRCKNIYVSEDMQKCVVRNLSLSKENKVTWEWIAPELMEGKNASLAIDIFSFGIVMFEVLSRTEPYVEIPSYMLPQKIISGDRPDIQKIDTSIVDPNLIKLMQECWITEPYKRPKFSDIIQILSSE